MVELTIAQQASQAEPAPKCNAEGQRSMSLPDIPDAYWSFRGKIVEVHAEDDCAAVVFGDMFCRKRFEAAFPEAVELPMPIGVDLEWKPDKFKKSDNPVALVQLACWDGVLLIRTVGCKQMPSWLADCLEDSTRIKITGSFDLSDRDKLLKTFGWSFAEKVSAPDTFVDVAELAKERNLPYGLKKMASKFELPMLKLKEIGCSDWSKVLSDAQKQYAAEDAFFTLYLFGCLLERMPPIHGGPMVGAFKAWKLIQSHMRSLLEHVDNSEYKKSFFELREVVREAMNSLCTALGSGGATTINHILKVKRVDHALKDAKKHAGISIDANFLKVNRDLFVLYWDHAESILKVRPRYDHDAEDDYKEDAEEEALFIARILELLVSYEPPSEKRQSVLHRSAPEPLWVPAKAIIGKNEQKRLQDCANRHREFLECASTDDDGLIVRMLRHPRALDSEEQLRRCCSKLREALGPDAPLDEAERRLRADEKFVQFYAQLSLIERGSLEEAAASRSLKARAQILSDAHFVGTRVNTQWELARDALEKVKWYRQLLGARLAVEADRQLLGARLVVEGGEGVETNEDAEIKACLNAIVESWPDVEKVECPKRSKKRNSDHLESRDSKGNCKGKGKKKRT